MCWPESQSRSASRWTTPTTTGRRWRCPIASSENRDHQARNASPRPGARVPTDEQHVGGVLGNGSADLPGILDDDAEPHLPRRAPGERARDGGECKHQRAVGHTAGRERGDHVLGYAGLLDLDQEIERRRGQQRQGVIEGERRSPANRGIVRDDERPPVRDAAHVELDAGNARIARRSREGSERILLGALAPAAMGDELHDVTSPGTPRARTRGRA